MPRKPTGKVRLAIDFRTPEALLEFVDQVKDVFPEYRVDVDAYAMDGLDEQGARGGVTSGNTFMLKRGRDRVPRSSLRELLTGEPVNPHGLQ